MAVQMSQADIEQIVSAVIKNITPSLQKTEYHAPADVVAIGIEAASESGAAKTGQLGVYLNMSDAIDAADAAQKKYSEGFKLEERKKIVESIRRAALQNKEVLAKMALEETKLGRYEDKIGKVILTAEKTPGTEVLTTEAVSGDEGLTIEEMAPFGVIGAVSPVTNPMETIFNNAIGMLAAGNAVVYNVHPSGKAVSAFTVDLINQAVVEAGGPQNLVAMVQVPTMETLQQLLESPKVKLLVGTGGPGLVKTLLKSGKKAIGAGAGNPPVIVDETADLAVAAREIIRGASFDNNILCIAEKEVFVQSSVADDLLYQFMKQGAYVLNAEQVKQIMEFALYRDAQAQSCGCSGVPTGEYHVQKDWVGRDASQFLNKIGVTDKNDVRLLVFEANFNHPFVQLEQMMPVLPIVRVNSLEEAIELAVKAEHGNRHTASMFSKNVDNLTRFARRIGTTIFVKNAATLAGVGFGGEGYTTFTIAGPTGEGLTCAKTFTRRRRCVLAEGGFRII